MDLGFFRRARSELALRSSATLDHGMLTATLQACQATNLTAQLQAQAPEGLAQRPASATAIVELLTGGPDWLEAVARQGGSFNPTCARNKEVED